MKTYISICKNTVLSNLKRGTNKPVIRVSHGLYGKPRRAYDLTMHGTVRVRYSPNKPTPWGARAWLEVDD